MKENPNYLKGSRDKSKSYKYLPKGIQGVYIIHHDKLGNFYVGQSNDIGRRLSHHFGKLNRGVHESYRFQELYNKTKYEDYSFYYVSIRKEDVRLSFEQLILDNHHESELLLNTTALENTWIGERNIELTNEWKNKISKSAKGRVGSKNPFYGKSHSEETKEKIGKSRKGISNDNCSKAIVINGIYYKSLVEASELLNLHITTISFRVNSDNPLYINWYSYELFKEIKIMDDRLLFAPSSKPSGLYYIDDVYYWNSKEITSKYNIKPNTMSWRFNSDNFPNWRRLI